MSANCFNKISFYTVAHADDWQLFMCPNVYNDLITSENKTVFIITTAGDAGKSKNFWLAREEGCKSSVRFCLAPLENFTESEGTKEFNNHVIYYWCAGNTVSYFLRLPDGNLNGSGFSKYNFQSLSKFKTGSISLIKAIDQSTTYYSWKDFFSTLEAIILAESNSITEKWINYLNPNTELNPNDHADHIASGQAIQCMNNSKTLWHALYVGYSSSNKENKLINDNLFWKAGMFAAYEKAVFDNSGYSTLHEDVDAYIKWCLCSADFTVIKPEHNLSEQL